MFSRVIRGNKCVGMLPPWDSWQHLGSKRARPNSPQYQTVSAHPSTPSVCLASRAAESALTPWEAGSARQTTGRGSAGGRGGSPTGGALSALFRAQSHGSGVQPFPAAVGRCRGWGTELPAPRPGLAPTAAASRRGAQGGSARPPGGGNLPRAYPEPRTGFAAEMCVSVRTGTCFQKGCVCGSEWDPRAVSLPSPRSWRTEADPSKGSPVQPPHPPSLQATCCSGRAGCAPQRLPARLLRGGCCTSPARKSFHGQRGSQCNEQLYRRWYLYNCLDDFLIVA